MIEHTVSLLCLHFGNTLNKGSIHFSWKNIDQVFEKNLIIKSNKTAKAVFFYVAFHLSLKLEYA